MFLALLMLNFDLIKLIGANERHFCGESTGRRPRRAIFPRRLQWRPRKGSAVRENQQLTLTEPCFLKNQELGHRSVFFETGIRTNIMQSRLIEPIYTSLFITNESVGIFSAL
ncbi:hypothetical protein CR205_08350 [Alteribacter lacisalsi]|uniref:Uncharacterized protein n=1 Tax=Alteribacter lacisalsi TaxID=2045244 RepID=A0A2W0HF01_9BACI|nr:hypothetical protein CR205_08350 [Alteribacter lacisalsi]